MKSILVIDDEAAIGQLIKMHLEKSGDYHVDSVTTALEGVEKASQVAYDVVVVDVLMPDISGFEAYKRIRALPGAHGQMPVITMSARPSMKNIFKLANIHAFVDKPFQVTKMKEMLDELCGIEVKPAAAAAGTDTVSPKGSKKVFIAGMEKFMMTTIQDYLQQLGFEVIVNYDEQDSLALAGEAHPALILYQFWEESEKFNALRLFKQTTSDSRTKDIPCLVFCGKSGAVEASKEIPKDKLLTYQDSRELLSKLRSHLSL